MTSGKGDVEPTAAFAQLQLGFMDQIQWRYLECYVGISGQVDKLTMPYLPPKEVSRWATLLFFCQ
jgi:hypothetical protein